MNAEQLLQHFERISEAPDAIPRLRRFILDLAVRGKLVEQETEHESASDLFKLIESEKTLLARQGLIKKVSRTEAVADEDEPFEVPVNWRWVRLGDILLKLTDGTHHSPLNGPEGDFKYITAKNIKPEGLALNNITYVSREVHEEIYSRCNPVKGDILYIKDGATTGVATVNDLDEPFSMLSSVALLKVPQCILSELIVLFLRSPFFYDQMRGFMKGAAITRVTLKRMTPALLPLPPLGEQHRIVAKVDELMTLCDQLEAAKAEREKCRDSLVAASLQGLNQPAEEEETFREHARFTFNNLPRITTRATHIKQLRQTILNLAVRGKLVSQDPSDEPAAELLNKIADKRTTLLKAGYPNLIEAKTQAKKLEEQAIPNAIQPLPMGWAWATLMQCSALVVDCKNKTAPYASKGIRLVRTTNVRNGRLNLTDQKYVDQSTYESWSARCTPEPRDILITREAPMGEVCLIPPGEQICLGQRMMLARLIPGTIDCNFMIYSLRDPKLMDRVQDKPVGATVQHLRVGGVETLLVPLPPLAEQHRIVAKVDELMAICDQLEAQITVTEQDSRRFLESVLADALAPGIDLSAEAEVA